MRGKNNKTNLIIEHRNQSKLKKAGKRESPQTPKRRNAELCYLKHKAAIKNTLPSSA